jgi:hypothetical protein
VAAVLVPHLAAAALADFLPVPTSYELSITEPSSASYDWDVAIAPSFMLDGASGQITSGPALVGQIFSITTTGGLILPDGNCVLDLAFSRPGSRDPHDPPLYDRDILATAPHFPDPINAVPGPVVGAELPALCSYA